jgi:prefoldin subunit 5
MKKLTCLMALLLSLPVLSLPAFADQLRTATPDQLVTRENINSSAATMENPVAHCICSTNSPSDPLVNIFDQVGIDVNRCIANAGKFFPIKQNNGVVIRYAALLVCQPRISTAEYMVNEPKTITGTATSTALNDTLTAVKQQLTRLEAEMKRYQTETDNYLNTQVDNRREIYQNYDEVINGLRSNLAALDNRIRTIASSVAQSTSSATIRAIVNESLPPAPYVPVETERQKQSKALRDAKADNAGGD